MTAGRRASRMVARNGTLRHAGWRATHIAVPARTGVDPFVLTPAEVEIA